MSSGRLFHRYGPACAKALSPHVLVDLGMIRAREVDERKFRAGMYGWTRDILYWGAEPWTQWKISNKILKTIRSLIGSQCRDCKIGVMWVRLGDNVTMRAAATMTVKLAEFNFFQKNVHMNMYAHRNMVVIYNVNILLHTNIWRYCHSVCLCDGMWHTVIKQKLFYYLPGKRGQCPALPFF